jgi:hypothetical protein
MSYHRTGRAYKSALNLTKCVPFLSTKRCRDIGQSSGFARYCTVPRGKNAGIISDIRPWPLPPTPLPIHSSSTTLPFKDTWRTYLPSITVDWFGCIVAKKYRLSQRINSASVVAGQWQKFSCDATDLCIFTAAILVHNSNSIFSANL